MRALINDWEKTVTAANDNVDVAVDWLDLLMSARLRLCDGWDIPRHQRKLIYRIAWANRAWLPPDLVLYAAIGGGICGDD